MKNHHLFISIMILLALSCGCTRERKQISAQMLVGNWISRVKTENTSGYDTLFLQKNEKLVMRQGIDFTGSDSGFDFRARANTKIEGKWSVTNDTLHVMYYLESLDMTWQEKEMNVKLSGTDSTRAIPSYQRKEMLDALKNALETNYKSQYIPLDSAYIMLGRVKNISSGSLELSNGGQSITLVRMH